MQSCYHELCIIKIYFEIRQGDINIDVTIFLFTLNRMSYVFYLIHHRSEEE